MKAKWCLYIDGCPSLGFFSSQYKRLLTGGHLTVEVGGGLQNNSVFMASNIIVPNFKKMHV